MRVSPKTTVAVVLALGVGAGMIIFEGSPRVSFKEQQFAVDLHIHSDRSPDSTAAVAAIIDQSVRIGLYAIAITDHYVDRAFRELQDGSLTGLGMAVVASEDRFIRIRVGNRQLTIVKGKELSTVDGVHIIALAYRGHVHNFQSYRETLREIHSLGGIAIIPHPFNTMSHGIGGDQLSALLGDPATRSWIDAIEVYNANSFYPQWRANARAERFGRDQRVPGVAVSDAHQARHIGLGATLLNSPLKFSSGDAFADSLRAAVRSESRGINGMRVPVRDFVDWFLWPKIRSLLAGRRATIAPPRDYMQY